MAGRPRNAVAGSSRRLAWVHKQRVAVRWEQEPGSAGKSLAAYYKKLLAGFDCDGVPSSGDKAVRARPFSAQAKAGNVRVVRAWWNGPYLNELCAFPNEEVHDDMVDGSSGGFDDLVSLRSGGMLLGAPDDDEEEDDE